MYLGRVQLELDGTQGKLISFVIDGGTITQKTDTDGDALKDYQELICLTCSTQCISKSRLMDQFSFQDIL